MKQKQPTALRELANSFRRMGDDANHVRLRHLQPRRGRIKADTMIRETHAAAANAYYNCMRTVRRLLPNIKLCGREPNEKGR